MAFFRLYSLDARHTLGFLRERIGYFFMGFLQRKQHRFKNNVVNFIGMFRKYCILHLRFNSAVQTKKG